MAAVLVPSECPIEFKNSKELRDDVQWYANKHEPTSITKYASIPSLAKALKVTRVAVRLGINNHAMSTDSLLRRDQYEFASKQKRQQRTTMVASEALETYLFRRDDQQRKRKKKVTEVEAFVDQTKPSFSHQAKQDAQVQCVSFDGTGTMITSINVPRNLPITRTEFLEWLKVKMKVNVYHKSKCDTLTFIILHRERNMKWLKCLKWKCLKCPKTSQHTYCASEGKDHLPRN